MLHAVLTYALQAPIGKAMNLENLTFVHSFPMETPANVQPKLKSTAGLFDQLSGYGHEQVVFFQDPHTGLKAIVAIHSTVLGPALGGTRMWKYATEKDALNDVLRLSRGMTFKASIAGINLGGGKAVIIADPYKDKSEALWRRYGKFIDGLSGRYITAEDVGTTTTDMQYIAMETDYCTGVPEVQGGSGDPSPVTAYGTYLGIKAAAKERWGTDSLNKKKIAVQGVGHVGQFLIGHLIKEGSEVYVSDINEKQLADVTRQHKVTVVPPEEIYVLDIDIYAPCALGATLNDQTIAELKCSVIAGAANNQLADETVHAAQLRDRGILYAPDFLINAGGVINCFSELEGYNREKANAYTEKIYDRTLQIFKAAADEDITTHEAAMRIAQKRIDDMVLVNAAR